MQPIGSAELFGHEPETAQSASTVTPQEDLTEAKEESVNLSDTSETSDLSSSEDTTSETDSHAEIQPPLAALPNQYVLELAGLLEAIQHCPTLEVCAVVIARLHHIV